MDSISGGRMELGIGAGWKRDEWLAYGYGFPETKERLAALGDHLEVITRMLDGDKHQHATFEGRYATVRDAINVPKPIQKPRVPIMVGGNGPNVTWRLAAKHADELNVDGMTPDEVAEALPVIAAAARRSAGIPHRFACRSTSGREASPRRARLGWTRSPGIRAAGVDRVMTLIRASATADDALASFAEDARAAGAELA